MTASTAVTASSVESAAMDKSAVKSAADMSRLIVKSARHSPASETSPAETVVKISVMVTGRFDDKDVRSRNAPI